MKKNSRNFFEENIKQNIKIKKVKMNNSDMSYEGGGADMIRPTPQKVLDAINNTPIVEESIQTESKVQQQYEKKLQQENIMEKKEEKIEPQVDNEVVELLKNFDPLLQEVGVDDLKKINALLGKARTQEKDKQYKTVNNLKKQINELEERNKQLTQALVNLKTETNDNQDKNEKVENEDVEKVLQEKISELTSNFQKELDKVSNIVNKKFEDIELNKYKEGLLEQYPEVKPLEPFIKGKTKEEIEASILSALQIRKEMLNGIEQQKINQVINKPTIPLQQPSLSIV